MDIHSLSPGEAGIKDNSYQTSFIVHYRQRCDRTGRDAKQSFHILGLSEAEFFRPDYAGQGFQIDSCVMRRGDQPELACVVLQKQVLGMRTGDFIMEMRAGLDGKDSVVLMKLPCDTQLAKPFE